MSISLFGNLLCVSCFSASAAAELKDKVGFDCALSSSSYHHLPQMTADVKRSDFNPFRTPTLTPSATGQSLSGPSTTSAIEPAASSSRTSHSPHSSGSTDPLRNHVTNDDAILDERQEIEDSRGMSKWVVRTIHDSKLDASLSYQTPAGSQYASYVNDCYALVASLCNEEELVTFNEAQKLENWMPAMQLEFDALVKNDTWYLTHLLANKKTIGTK